MSVMHSKAAREAALKAVQHVMNSEIEVIDMCEPPPTVFVPLNLMPVASTTDVVTVNLNSNGVSSRSMHTFDVTRTGRVIGVRVNLHDHSVMQLVYEGDKT